MINDKNKLSTHGATINEPYNKPKKPISFKEMYDKGHLSRPIKLTNYEMLIIYSKRLYNEGYD